MLCQGKKRIDWQEKLSSRMLNVPYAHITFTLPREINHLAKLNQKVVYNILMRSAWLTIKSLCAEPENLGALPGMVSVLHTWGSDLKYHLHVHTLVTFGGLDSKLNWHCPVRKNKLAGFRALCNTFKEIFLEQLSEEYSKDQIYYHLSYGEVEELVKKLRWVVNHQRPTANTFTIENYLAKYICRSAVTTRRLQYNPKDNIVKLLYNDYRNQQTGNPAPKKYRKMHPLDAIHNIVQHKLPPYFQRSRYYGLHSSAKYTSIKNKIEPQLKRNPEMIKILFSIMKKLLNIPTESSEIICSNCQSKNLEISEISKDTLWPPLNIRFYNAKRGPPKLIKHKNGFN